MRARYFAWLRERVGRSEEELFPPATVVTVRDLLDWLIEKGEPYAHAFEKPEVVRVALDQRHVRFDAPIAGAAEIAFFPPMTGG